MFLLLLGNLEQPWGVLFPLFDRQLTCPRCHRDFETLISQLLSASYSLFHGAKDLLNNYGILDYVFGAKRYQVLSNNSILLRPFCIKDTVQQPQRSRGKSYP